MDPVPFWLIALIIVSAALHLRGTYGGPGWLAYGFKPLTMAGILALALMQPYDDAAYRQAILVGLALSLAGDVFLMLPERYFRAGLFSFLLAHLSYIAAFASGMGARLPLPPAGSAAWPLFAVLMILLLGGGMVVRHLWPHLGALRGPVLLYVAVILAMGMYATAFYLHDPAPSTALAATSAGLFILSDAALAVNRFATPFRAAQMVVMTTYFAAQTGFALSI